MSDIPLFHIENVLPVKLGALVYSGADIYEDPRLGAKLRYDCGMTKADVYLYDLGLDSIPEDIHSEKLVGFFRQACNDVFYAADQGMYMELETRASEYFSFSDDAPEPAYLWAAFRYRQAGIPFVADEHGFRFSHIFLRTDHAYINKVRYTYLEDAKAEAGPEMIHFLLDWQIAISEVMGLAGYPAAFTEAATARRSERGPGDFVPLQ